MKSSKILTALAIAAGMSGSIFAQNLIENAGFESGIDTWETPNWKLPDNKTWLIPQLDTTTSQGLGGMQSMRMDFTLGKITHIVYHKTITLPADWKEFTVSFWTKSTGYPDATKGQCFIQLHFPNVNKREQVITPWNRTQPEWTQFSKDFKIPEKSDRKVRVIIGIHGYKNKAGTTWIDNIYLGPKQAKAEKKSVEKEITMLRGVPRAEHNGIWYPGEKMQYDIEVEKVKNPGTKATLKWRIEGFDRELLKSGETQITLPANPPPPKRKWMKVPVIKIPFVVPDLGDYRGWFAFKAEIIQNGRALDGILSAGVVVEKAPEKRDPFFIAKNPGSIERQIRMGNGAGFIQTERRYLQEKAGELSVKGVKKLDESVKTLVDNGFRPIFCFMISQNINRQYPQQPLHIRKKIGDMLDKGLDPYDKEYYDGYEEFLNLLVQRYGKYVDDWTIGDEIYHQYHKSKLELPHYYEVTKRLHKVVKAADKNDFVAGAGCFMDMSPIGKVVWNELKDYLDGLSCSLYIQPSVVAEGMTMTGLEDGNLKERFAITRKVIGDKKAIVGTESGYSFLNFPALDSDIVKNAAINNARNIVMLRYLGVKYWTYFLFQNDGSFESAKWGYGKTDYGIWNKKTGSPKPLAATWAVSARMMAFVTDPMEVKPNSDTFCYLFRKNGKTLAAVWANSLDPINTEINMPTDWKETDLMGKTRSGKKGKTKLKLNNRVRYYELAASQKAVADAFRNARYVMPEIYVTMNRKNATEMNVLVKNKLNKAIQVKVQFNNGSQKNVQIAADATKAIAFPCKMEGKKLTASATFNGVKYDAALTDEAYIVTPLTKAPAMDGTLKGFESVKPVVMDKRDFLQPPDAEGFGYWTGAKDLSGKFYFAYDKKYFYVAADVTDDIHITRAADVLLWNQDSLQFGFDMNNDSFDFILQKPGYNSNDYEFCAAMTTKGPQLYSHTQRGAAATKLCTEKPMVTRTKDGHTLYVVRIPWTELGNFKPAPGKVIGFSFVLFDVDQKVGGLSYWMQFSRGIAGGGKDPRQFKRFVLK